MATKRKSSSTRRKPGASKATRKRKRVSGAPTPATMAIAGVRFKKSTCHKTKSEAQKSAEGKRARGQRARVIKSGTGYCVYARGRAKAA